MGPNKTASSKHYTMIRNYLKIAFRSLFKQKGLAFINVFGLSLGLACFALFLLYAVHEFSFDRFHTDGDRIYRMHRWIEAMDGDDPEADPYLPMPLGPAMVEEFPDVEAAVRWKSAWGENFVRLNGQVSRAEVSHVDPGVFELFDFPILYGDNRSPLADPLSVVLTESMAMQLFGEANPTGKTIDIQIEEDFEPFTVSAVTADPPSNSSLTYAIMGSFDYYTTTAHGSGRADNWGSSFLNVFLKLREGSGLATNEEALLSFRQKYYPGEEERLREDGRWEGEGAPVTYRLQSLSAIHSNPEIAGGMVASVNPRNIWILLAIAGGVLLIAVINFTTLAIGRSANRAREIGIRKVVGSSRSLLIGQFMTEALVLAVISGLFGLLLAYLLLPYFNDIAGRELVLSFTEFPQMATLFAGMTLLAGLLAGSYPALMLSGFRPLDVLRDKIRLGGSNVFTKSLVTTQFVLSSGLVIATLVIVNQLNFLQSKNPGFNKENVVVVDAEGVETDRVYPLFKSELEDQPEILGVTSAELSMGAGMGWSRSGFTYNGELKSVFEYYVEDDYLNVMGLEVLAGRDFDPTRQDGANRSIIINEAMMKDFGWTLENAVGQELTEYHRDPPAPKVVGVVKDFHYRSFATAVDPQMFHQFTDYSPFKFLVRFQSEDPSLALSKMEDAWSTVAGDYPFTYSFLDEDLGRFYRSEERFSQIIGWAGGISILLACLGLLGLSALAAANRTKEIGIRKVLGASITGIVGLLSKDFLKLVVIALLIASPLAYYLMTNWLQDFAYRIDIEWWVFALAGLAAVAVAFVTISFQSIRAALANPVKALRSE